MTRGEASVSAGVSLSLFLLHLHAKTAENVEEASNTRLDVFVGSTVHIGKTGLQTSPMMG